MCVKKAGCIVLVCIVLLGIICIPAGADESNYFVLKDTSRNSAATFASNSFTMSIPVKSLSKASTSLSLEAGESVTIKASYSPFSAVLDVGLITPSGKYYGYSVSGGTVNNTIQVDERGNYTLQIRNNSNYEVQVSGYVNY